MLFSIFSETAYKSKHQNIMAMCICRCFAKPLWVVNRETHSTLAVDSCDHVEVGWPFSFIRPAIVCFCLKTK